MTALCGGGPSGAQPNVGPILTLGSVAIEAFLTSLGFPELAPIVAPIIGALVDIQINEFCGTDPPADPGLTSTDVNDALAIPPNASTLPAQQKILNWFLNRYWFQICQCSGTSTPAPPTLSNPGNPSVNTGLPSVSTNTQCWNVSTTLDVPAGSNSGTLVDAGGTLLPSIAPQRIGVQPIVGNAGTCVAQTVPTGATQFALDCTAQSTMVGGVKYSVDIVFWTQAGAKTTPNGLSVVWINSPAHQTISLATIPANAVFWTADVYSDFQDFSTTCNFSFFCPNSPGGGLATPCCPPDPLIENKLDLIYQLLSLVYQGLPVPINSYANGTVHAGLNGNGTITLVGAALAIRVDITTDPASLGVVPGDPPYLFDRGFIVPVINGAPVREFSRLVYNPQLFTLPALTEQIGFSLHPGVVASITELTKGP